MTEHIIITDLGYGDAGKGTTTDYLCATRNIEAVIRYNGGAQAAHNVVSSDGRHHTFAQWGSGTFHGVKTHLSQYVLVNPLNAVKEAEHLTSIGIRDPWSMLTVDERALLITPYHRKANQLRELARGSAAHGSCGQGIGETQRYALDNLFLAPRIGDMKHPKILGVKLQLLQQSYSKVLGAFVDVPSVEDLVDWYSDIAENYLRIVPHGYYVSLLDTGDCVFEGAQGVLLDEWHGFHPYTTWSTTTSENAETMLQEAGHVGTVWGVTRSYMTRHGHGPFVTETSNSDILEQHNGTGTWQGPFRIGELDLLALRYAIAANASVDRLVVTHVDRVPKSTRVANQYATSFGVVTDIGDPNWEHDLSKQNRLTNALFEAQPIYTTVRRTDLIDYVSEQLDVPVALTSHGPRTSDKIEHVLLPV